MYDEMYIEPYRRENFIIVPLDKRMPLTNNIRTDLNEPLRYLLLVENEKGRMGICGQRRTRENELCLGK